MAAKRLIDVFTDDERDLLILAYTLMAGSLIGFIVGWAVENGAVMLASLALFGITTVLTGLWIVRHGDEWRERAGWPPRD